MNTEPALFSIDHAGRVMLPEGNLAALTPFVKLLCDTDTNAAARILRDVPKDRLGEVFNDFLLDAAIAYNPLKIQGLTDVAEKLGALDVFVAQKNNPLSMLASIGDEERVGKLIAAAKASGTLRSLFHRIGIVKRGTMGVNPLVIAIKNGHAALAEKILDEIQQAHIAPDLLNNNNILQDLLMAVESCDAKTIRTLTSLADEIDAHPDAKVFGDKNVRDEITRMDEGAQKMGAPDNAWGRYGGLRGTLMNYAIAWSMLDSWNKTKDSRVFEALADLSKGNAKREALFAEKVAAVTNMSGPVAFDVLGESLRGKLADHKPSAAVITLPPKTKNIASVDATNVPMNFNHALYRELLTFTTLFDEAEACKGNGPEWARKATMLFATKEQFWQYLRQVSLWLGDNMNNLNLWEHAISSASTTWPEELEHSPYANKDFFEQAFKFEVPTSQINLQGWRNLILESPEATRYLKFAHDIEAVLHEQGKQFPHTIEQMRDALTMVAIKAANNDPKMAELLLMRTQNGEKKQSATQDNPGSFILKSGLRMGIVSDVALKPIYSALLECLNISGLLGASALTSGVRSGDSKAFEFKEDNYKVWNHETVQTVLCAGDEQEIDFLEKTYKHFGARFLHGVAVDADISNLSEPQKLELAKQLQMNVLEMRLTNDCSQLVGHNYRRELSNIGNAELRKVKIIEDTLGAKKMSDLYEKSLSSLNSGPVGLWINHDGSLERVHFNFSKPNDSSGTMQSALKAADEVMAYSLEMLKKNDGKATPPSHTDKVKLQQIGRQICALWQHEEGQFRQH